MAWTYAAIKSADAALSPAIADPGAAATALNAQTVTLTQPASDIGLGDIQGILLLNRDWPAVVKRASETPSGATPPTATDLAIEVAGLAVALVQSKAASVAAANWASFLQMTQALVAAGDVSSASYAAISALAAMTAPVWQPALTAGDIQTARAQP